MRKTASRFDVSRIVVSAAGATATVRRLHESARGGASAVGLRDELRPIFKIVLLPAAVLLAVVLVTNYVLTWV